jgi:transposase
MQVKMSNKPITMNKIKQIIRGCVQGRGTKQLSNLTGVSRNTVKQYLNRFRTSGLTLEQVEAMQDSTLADIFIRNVEPVLDEERQSVLQPLLPGIVKALRKKGVTSLLLWDQYILAHPNGYKLSQFRHYIRLHLQKKNVSMHFEHKAGDKAFIDYAGKHLYLTDLDTGEHIATEVFLSVLGCSQYTYVEASLSQKKEDFIESNRRMLEFFGGVPRALVPDNMKSAVQKGSKYAPILNETFETFADHYNTTILPTRPRQPKDKSLVEGAVKLIYQHIYTKLEAEVFTSLNELNAAIWKALEEFNNKPLRGEESRKQLFMELEQSELLALPDLPYILRQTKVCTVMKNSHVCLSEDKHYYSVPYRYMGKKVKLLYSDRQVEVFFKYHKIASHPRD